MNALNKALETSHTYEFTNEECMSLLGAIESRIRFLDQVIEDEADNNHGMVEAATAEKGHLEKILSKIGF